MSVAPQGAAPDEPGGEDALGTYEWLQRGMRLLEAGHAAAAATVLERVAADEPRSASVLEALGRAQYTAGRPGAAVTTFERLADVAPDSDYARFGYGQSLRRVGRLPQAAEQLALAVAMRPHRPEYVEALARVRELLAPRGLRSGGATATSGRSRPDDADADPGAGDAAGDRGIEMPGSQDLGGSRG
ncbi:tetratricopeptide repeat protein [Pseudokineococcus basanitobsidens]|uniref:Tetratricopeptide repeat protein n=1 Tax=Pseudokineococcus basanitobsidens TaxID=1926649 RepID=A0ABU8RN71_9ACTN